MTAVEPIHTVNPPLARPNARNAAHRGASPLVLQMAILSGAAATIALWWFTTPRMHGVAEWFTNAGQVTGLLAGYAIIVLLALMARVPAIEYGVGADRLARWHSMGGRYTVGLVTAHALMITWGYSLSDHQNAIAETGILWTQYADVLMATVAWALLVGVGIASARAARKRLRYETWHFIHFYTYLATALAFSHQFSTGAQFVNNPPARLVWGAAYAMVAVAIVRYRFLAPVFLSRKHDLRVEQVVAESADTISVLISGRQLRDLRVESGQFFRWRFLRKDLWWSANPYSLSAPVDDTRLRITVKMVGDHSRSLQTLRPGTPVIAEGPYGAMTQSKRRKRSVLLLAGGVGVTPLRALFETLSAHGADVVMIYRAGDTHEVLFHRELEQLSHRYNARVMYSIGPRGGHTDVLAGDRLTRILPDVRNRDVFVCGPPGMMTASVAALRTAGVPRRRIHREDFDMVGHS